MELTIEQLGLSTRCRTGLARAGLTTVEQLMQYPYRDIVELRILGAKSLIEIWEKLHQLNIISRTELEATIKEKLGTPTQRTITSYIRSNQ